MNKRFEFSGGPFMDDADAEAAFDFARVLLNSAELRDLRKAERTRVRLLASIANRLADGTEHMELRVADVTSAAGVAHGTFYLHFPDLRSAIETLVGDFAEFLYKGLALAREGTIGSRERIRGATLVYARAFRINAGLMRCLLSLGRENSSFRVALQKLSEGWNKRVAVAIARRRQVKFSTDDALYVALLPTAYALGGMVDDFLTQLYLRNDPALASLAGDDEAIADILTDVWSFGAYGRMEESA